MEQDETQLTKFNHQTLNVNQVRFVIVLQFHILLQTMSCHEYFDNIPNINTCGFGCKNNDLMFRLIKLHIF